MQTIKDDFIDNLETVSVDLEQVIKALNVFMEFCTTDGNLECCKNSIEKATQAIIFAERANKFYSILYTAEQTLCKDVVELEEVITKGIEPL